MFRKMGITSCPKIKETAVSIFIAFTSGQGDEKRDIIPYSLWLGRKKVRQIQRKAPVLLEAGKKLGIQKFFR